MKNPVLVNFLENHNCTAADIWQYRHEWVRPHQTRAVKVMSLARRTGLPLYHCENIIECVQAIRGEARYICAMAFIQNSENDHYVR